MVSTGNPHNLHLQQLCQPYQQNHNICEGICTIQMCGTFAKMNPKYLLLFLTTCAAYLLLCFHNNLQSLLSTSSSSVLSSISPSSPCVSSDFAQWQKSGWWELQERFHTSRTAWVLDCHQFHSLHIFKTKLNYSHRKCYT